MLQLAAAKNTISPKDMKDGQIAIITDWAADQRYRNTIVQRYENRLIALGKKSGQSWTNINTIDGEHKVRLLEIGETIVVTETN